MDITHDNVCSSMLSCFYSHLLSKGRPISSLQMKQGLVRLLYNFCKRFMGWTLHMIMCVLLRYPVSIHMSQLLSTGRPISS